MASMLNTNSQNLVRGEYFTNTDPGYGLATNFAIASPDSDITQSFNIPYSSFSGPGYHNVFFRVLDENGRWSQTSRRFVEVGENTNPDGIVEVEYFFDTDDEFGNNASITLTESADSTWIINIPASEVPVSWTSSDVVYLRVKQNTDSKWSHTTNTTIDSVCTVDSTTDVISACNQYTWIDGITYTADNATATHILSNIGGCDSVITLDLNITSLDVSVLSSENILSANAAGVSYQWLDCTNGFAIITNATDQSFTSNVNGDFAVLLSANGCQDTSTCISILVESLDSPELTQNKSFQVLPNPNNGQFELKFNKQFEGIISVYELSGKLLIQQNISTNSQIINNSIFSPGIYLVRTIDISGNTEHQMFVVN